MPTAITNQKHPSAPTVDHTASTAYNLWQLLAISLAILHSNGKDPILFISTICYWLDWFVRLKHRAITASYSQSILPPQFCLADILNPPKLRNVLLNFILQYKFFSLEIIRILQPAYCWLIWFVHLLSFNSSEHSATESRHYLSQQTGVNINFSGFNYSWRLGSVVIELARSLSLQTVKSCLSNLHNLHYDGNKCNVWSSD